MKQKYTKPITEHDKPESASQNGKDEMNLTEFPFASLRRRGDSRNAIAYEGWIVDKDGNRHVQRWTVAGSTIVGLPTEFDERVYVALMAISAERGFKDRKTPFSVYRILKIMDEGTDRTHYEAIERSLDRLKGVTIKAEGTFWDNERKELIRTVVAFNLIDEYWLRYKETDEKVREAEGVPGYVIWGERIWKSIQSNYIKPLDIGFFYSLQSPIARRLYRLLDKRMWNRDKYEFDIFDLASRLGMVRYAFPTEVRKKLQSALDELISKGFLASAKIVKHKTKDKTYTRIRFVKVSKSASQPAKQHDDAQEEAEAYHDRYTTQLNALRKHYGITDDLVDIWEQALVEIEGATTQANFHAWFPQTHLLSCRQDAAIIGVPSTYAQDWLAGRMTPVIKRALEGAVGHAVDQLSFQVLTLPKGKD